MLKKQISSSIIKNEQIWFQQLLPESGHEPKKQQHDESLNEPLRRGQNTLSLLTKNFIQLIKSKENMTIDSNDAAHELGIQKRRIYDITNVLQGIGYVQKIHKNKLRWVGGVRDPQINCQIQNLDLEIESLQKKQHDLVCKIQYLQKRIKNDFLQNKELNFLRLSYLIEVMGNLPSRPGRIIIVKAPKDTALHSHQNPTTGQTQIQIYFSKQSKASVFYITKKSEEQIKPRKKVKIEEGQKEVKLEDY